MSVITVSDVLHLPSLSSARVKAGMDGLDRQVEYVSVFDNYISELDFESLDTKSRNSFFLTAFYHGKDNPQYILYALKYFHSIHTAALCIIDENMDELPEEAYAYANQCGLPILFIDKNVPYSIIISEITEQLLFYKNLNSQEEILAQLADRELSDNRKALLIQRLNPYFAKNVLCFYCRVEAGTPLPRPALAEKFSRDVLFFAAGYRGGILIIRSFKDNSAQAIDKYISQTASAIFESFPECMAGISCCCPLYSLGDAISQAYHAAASCPYQPGKVVYFRALGVLRLFLKLEGHPAIDEFYLETAQPILDYDEKYHSHLIHTINDFIENDMDYTKTSKALFVHENTIRYRINKVKNMIPYGQSDTDFLQTLYILYIIRKLKDY